MTVSREGQQASLSVLDQCIISGSNFMMTVLVGRYAGAEQLGYYSLAFATLIFFQVVHEAMIWTPVLIFGARLDDQSFEQYAGKVMTLQGGLSLISVAIVLLATGCLYAMGEYKSLLRIFLILVTVMPFIFLRDFIRRTLLARLRIKETLVLDILNMMVLFGILAFLMIRGMLTAESVLLAAGLAGIFVSSLWFILSSFYRSLKFRYPALTLQQHWTFGRWLCAGQIADVIQNYGLSWLIAFSVGAAATGVFNAYWSIVLIFNPLVMGVSNILLPTASQVYQRSGNVALRKLIGQTTLILGTIMSVLCLGLITSGERLISLLYNNSVFDDHKILISLLALAALVHTISFAANQGLLICERPEINVAFKIPGIVAMIIISLFAMVSMGVEGAALGRLAGALVAGLGQCVAFIWITRSFRESRRQ